MRVTNQMQAAHISRSLQHNLAQQAKLAEQGSSGSKLTRASDDPAGAADALAIRNRAAAEAQFARNIDNGNSWLTMVDATLTHVTNVLHRTRDLALQGGSDTSSAEARHALATEVDQLGKELMALANTTHMGRTIFAGTSDEGVAYHDDYTHTGTAGASVERRISAEETVRVDAEGRDIFGEGSDSVFALLDTIAADLRANTSTAAAVDEIDAHISKVLSAQTTAGARMNRLERAAEANNIQQINF